MEFGSIAKWNLTIECWFYSQQPMRMLIHSVNSSSAFNKFSRIYHAYENEPQTVGKCGKCFKI